MATTTEAVRGGTDPALSIARERRGREEVAEEGRMEEGMVVVGEQDGEGQRR